MSPSLAARLPLRAPLNLGTGAWAIAPDLQHALLDLIDQMQPRLVVELGSGVSTIVMGYALARIGGRAIALEHLPEFRAQTIREIAKHGLGLTCQVIAAPLRVHRIDGTDWRWYDLANFEPGVPIDLLLVDGPPGATQREARYPALPLLRSHLADHAVVVLDDCGRPDERSIVERWSRAFPEYAVAHVAHTRGTAIFRKI